MLWQVQVYLTPVSISVYLRASPGQMHKISPLLATARACRCSIRKHKAQRQRCCVSMMRKVKMNQLETCITRNCVCQGTHSYPFLPQQWLPQVLLPGFPYPQGMQRLLWLYISVTPCLSAPQDNMTPMLPDTGGAAEYVPQVCRANSARPA